MKHVLSMMGQNRIDASQIQKVASEALNHIMGHREWIEKIQKLENLLDRDKRYYDISNQTYWKDLNIC